VNGDQTDFELGFHIWSIGDKVVRVPRIGSFLKADFIGILFSSGSQLAPPGRLREHGTLIPLSTEWRTTLVLPAREAMVAMV
jgi:hypothetical protein